MRTHCDVLRDGVRCVMGGRERKGVGERGAWKDKEGCDAVAYNSILRVLHGGQSTRTAQLCAITHLQTNSRKAYNGVKNV